MKLLVAILLSLFLVACSSSDDGSPLQPDANGGDSGAAATQAAPSNNNGNNSSNAGNAGAELPSLASVVEKIRPATVQVTTQANVPFGQSGRPLAVPQGTGTGFIFDDEGHILTNAHVVEGGTAHLVTLANGEARQARLIGRDPRTDIAVLKVSGSSLPTAALGDASKVKVGDWTVAIGHALGLQGGPTVTAGVVGAVGRHVQEPAGATGGGSYLFDLLQTDAAINPGNSGGPLVNLNGEVIGMNTMVAALGESVPAQGIGFAISINYAKSIADQLVEDGRVSHPSLGVNFVPLNPAIALQLGADEGTKGAAIAAVEPGSAAAEAGLRSRDIIIAVDGKAVKQESDLPRLISQKKPGDRVELTVLRDGREQKLNATLDEAES